MRTNNQYEPPRCKIIFFVLFILAPSLFIQSFAQNDGILGKVRGRMQNFGQASGKTDSLGFQHRDDLADSITISYKFLDSLKSEHLDSTLHDFSNFFSVPAHYITLGNNGSAGYPILFTPNLKAGWDAGFHAYDAYRYTIEGTKFYKTTKPFSQLTYLLASGKEQVIKILHTQNIRSNWNFGFDYRLVAAPGFFKTQNTSHNNYRLFSNYTGKKKRYSAFFVIVGNKLTASENGGIRNDSLLSNPDNAKRFTIPVNLGGDAQFGFNVFSTKVNTGNIYKEFTFFLRQGYDFGKRDSIEINDSTKEYLFYPKLRFQHTFTYTNNSYQFKDTLAGQIDAQADSGTFKRWYDTTLSTSKGLSYFLQDKWKIITNDFVLRQFPETKNPAQFIEAGIRIENMAGFFTTGRKNYYNLALHGEYRNKTRNKKWDALAKGEFYLTGLNSGDYNAYATLTRFLNTRLGDVQLTFQNVNRSPSFIFDNISSFNLGNNRTTKKENIISFTAAAENPKFSIWFRNISIANYTYFLNYYQAAQYSRLFNITQVEASKRFNITRHLHLYSDALVQQTDGAAPVKFPLFYTRQQLALEGLYYKNLNLSTGLDITYYSSFKAYNYSPVIGQFFPQDSVTISNRPVLNFFFHFRIKSFTGLVRFENLNTANFSQGFGFTHNNFAAPHYPTPGLIFRIGVQWNFVN
ncbi:MAG: putative porin [Ginsengibacter sp.]